MTHEELLEHKKILDGKINDISRSIEYLKSIGVNDLINMLEDTRDHLIQSVYIINTELYREESKMKLKQLKQQYEELRSEAEMCESWIRYTDSIGLNALVDELADELEDRLDKVESLMYVVNTQINKLEVNK